MSSNAAINSNIPLSSQEENISPIAQCFNKFLDFETAHNLHKLRYKNIKIWEYIRYHVFYEIAQYSEKPNEDVKKISSLGRLIRLFETFLIYIKDSIKCYGKKYDIVFFNTTDRTQNIDGRYVNIYTYPIINSLKDKYKILLIDESGGVIPANYPCDVKRQYFCDTIDRILPRLILKFPHFISDKKKLTAIASDISEKIERTFGKKIDVFSVMKRYFLVEYLKKTRYTKFFPKSKVKIIIFANNGFMKGIIDAAQTTGVKSIDTQHSLLSDLNILYKYSASVKDDDKLPSDYFFSFGDYWHRHINSGEKTIAAGFPYFDIEYGKVYNKQNLHTEDTLKPKNVIIISNGYYLKDQLSGLVIRLSEIMPDYNFYYKMRPEEYEKWRVTYPLEFQNSKNIIVIDKSTPSLYSYFARCSYQIGVNSGAIYEGLAFNLMTFILKAGFYEEMSELYKNGYATLVTSPEEIKSKITRQEIQHRSMPELRNEFFKEGALTNITKFINELAKHEQKK